MPFYEVQHTYPLTPAQQQSIAQHITTIHSTAFVVPSLFVNVVFNYFPLPPAESSSDRPTTTYFLAGKPTPHHPAGPNRILGMVRQGPNRTKADFDRVTQSIEDAWYEVVNSKGDSEAGNAVDSKESIKAKKLHMVMLYPMITAREAGTTIPASGEEASWLRDNMPHFKSQAYEHDDAAFKSLLEEIDSRDDLKALV